MIRNPQVIKLQSKWILQYILRIFTLPFPDLIPVLKAFIPGAAKRDGDEGDGEDEEGETETQSMGDIEGSAVNVHVGKCILVLHHMVHQPSISGLREALEQIDVFGHKAVISLHKPMQKLTNSTQFKLLLKQCHEAVTSYELDTAANAKVAEVKDLVNELQCTVDQVMSDPNRQNVKCAFIALED